MSDIISFYIPGTKSFETDNEAGKITLTDSKEAKSSIIIPRSKIASSKRICDTLIVGYNWDGIFPDNPDLDPPDPSKPYYDPNYPDDPWWGIESNNGDIDKFLDKFDLMSTDHSGNEVKIQDHVRWHEYTNTDMLEVHYLIDIYMHHKWTDPNSGKTYEGTVKEKYDSCYEIGTFGYVDLPKWRRKGNHVYRYSSAFDEPEQESYVKRFYKAFPSQYYSQNPKYYENDFGEGSPFLISLCRWSVKKIKGGIESSGYDRFKTSVRNTNAGLDSENGNYTEKDAKVETVNTSTDFYTTGTQMFQLTYDYTLNGKKSHAYPQIQLFCNTDYSYGRIKDDDKISELLGTEKYAVNTIFETIVNNRAPFSNNPNDGEDALILTPSTSTAEHVSYRIINTIVKGNIL